MIRFRKPTEPSGFAATVANADPQPRFKGRPLWRKYKRYLAVAQAQKCGFCEVKVTSDRYKGDVEHFRPKGRVDLLEIADDGKRRQTPLWSTGYWWLAYSWENYLLSCNPCNSAYKKNYFPIRESRDPEHPPAQGAETAEHPMVLNPFRGPDPAKHLQFDTVGQVTQVDASEIGRSTIDVCGLDREELRDLRSSTAELIHVHVDRLDAATQAEEPVAQLLCDIYRLGRIEVAHAGMVRTVFTQRTQHTWRWLVTEVATTLAQKIASQPTPVTNLRLLEEMHDLGFERVAAVRGIFERNCGHSWAWLTDEVMQIKADRLQAALAGGTRIGAVLWLVNQIHRVGLLRASARRRFERQTGQPWSWLEQQSSQLP